MKTKVALIFGGRSLESDISVITAMQTLRQFRELDYAVEPFYMSDGAFYFGGLRSLAAFTPFVPAAHTRSVLIDGAFYSVKKNKLTRVFKPDAAFLCCHGGEGENGTLQAMLDFNGIPYASSGVLGSAVGMDKAVAKELFDNMLLNVIPHVVVYRDDFKSEPEKVLFHLETFLSYPLIVKPAGQGSSIGIGVAENYAELKEAISIACEFDDKMLVEQKLTDFVEVNCAAFREGNEIVLSETEQPVTFNNFLTFEDKYMDNGKMSGGGHMIPADIGALDAVVRSNTERVYRELGLKGIVRVDFLVDKGRGKVYVNEINTIPGSMAYYLFEPLGITFSELVDRQLKDALAAAENARRVRRQFKSGVLELYGKGAKGVKRV